MIFRRFFRSSARCLLSVFLFAAVDAWFLFAAVDAWFLFAAVDAWFLFAAPECPAERLRDGLVLVSGGVPVDQSST
ncbi:hypothetical protein ACWENQ_14780 [Nonomuraea sp. NPDC004354]